MIFFIPAGITEAAEIISQIILVVIKDTIGSNMIMKIQPTLGLQTFIQGEAMINSEIHVVGVAILTEVNHKQVVLNHITKEMSLIMNLIKEKVKHVLGIKIKQLYLVQVLKMQIDLLRIELVKE